MLYDPKWEQKTEIVEQWRVILHKAADLIEQRGHCKEALEDRHGALCMGGAVNVADTGRSGASGPIKRSEPGIEAIKRLHAFCPPFFTMYNNAPNRTADEAVAKLRECAESR